MSKRTSNRKDVFCAFCKSPRKIYSEKHIGGVLLTLSLLITLGISYVIWETLDIRSFAIFALSVLIIETTMQLRWRKSLICKECAFDPILYKRSTQLASEKVRIRLENRKNDPAAVFAKPLDLPKRPPPKGTYLNRKVDFKEF